jgi:hypothetical protein
LCPFLVIPFKLIEWSFHVTVFKIIFEALKFVELQNLRFNRGKSQRIIC